MIFETIEATAKESVKQGAPFSFQPGSVFYRGLRLSCSNKCVLSGAVTALVQGIEVGGCVASRQFEVGDLLNIEINYFPSVNFPTEIRFAYGDIEIARPFPINSSNDVMNILGSGDIRIEHFRLEMGLLRGSIVNTSNGVHTPSAYIRINALMVRAVAVEPPRQREQGGAISLFAVPISLSDFAENGLVVDFYIAGIDFPVANFTFIRSDPATESRRVVEIDEKVRQLQRSTSLQLEIVSDNFDRRLALQQERVDAFIEYAIALIMSAVSDPSGTLNPADFVEALRQSGQLVREQPGRTAIGIPTVSSAPSAAVALDSQEFAFGWYGLEMNESGYFRWMGQTSLIRNPSVSRPVSKVQLTVNQVYGAHEPMLQAALDEQSLIMSLENQQGLFIVTFTARPSSGFITGQSLRIESFATGSPALDHGSNDNRILSVSVQDVRFFYGDMDGSS